MNLVFKAIIRAIIGIFLLIFLLYLAIPAPKFPSQPPDSVQSLESGDVETPSRRGYFTNYDRGEVLAHYENQMKIEVLGIELPHYRLNYPPEDAQWLIRDQTKSTFLEEIVHPFRESLFVNGFESDDPQYAVSYRGVQFRQHITVRYSSSNLFVRVLVFSSSFGLLFVILRLLFREFRLNVRDWFAK